MAGDTLSKLKSSLNRSVTTISMKTSSSLEKAKIKTHIESITTEIEELVMSVGESAYEAWEKDTHDFSVLNEKFESIKQKLEAKEQLEIQFESIDDRDKEILGNNEKTAEAGTTCSSCGETYEVAVKFCKKCGNSLS
ncbi:MAG: hypothetical protein R3Y07_10170 [Eubacteriales bacterium]